MVKLIVVLAAVALSVGGCNNSSIEPQRQMTGIDYIERAKARMQPEFAAVEKRRQRGLEWQRDWVKFLQDVNDWSAESNSITEQEHALLMTLDDKADFQLYKDFLLYIEPSEDQIKTLEFIERMRAALPPDKMKQIEALNFQYRDLQLKGKLLQNRQAALKERARENLRESEAATAAADAAVNSMHR
jgi:hypothetical protein